DQLPYCRPVPRALRPGVGQDDDLLVRGPARLNNGPGVFFPGPLDVVSGSLVRSRPIRCCPCLVGTISAIRCCLCLAGAVSAHPLLPASLVRSRPAGWFGGQSPTSVAASAGVWPSSRERSVARAIARISAWANPASRST